MQPPLYSSYSSSSSSSMSVSVLSKPQGNNAFQQVSQCIGRQRLSKVILFALALVFAVNHLCHSVHELFFVRYVDGKRCERFSPRHLEMAYYQPKRCFSREDVQQIMVDLVGNITDLLQDNGIPYWLHAGTLLGSYRHKTVIPHDVDADVGINEAGYRKLRDGKFTFSSDFDLQVYKGKYHQPGTRNPGIPARFIHQDSGFYANIFVFMDEDELASESEPSNVAAATTSSTAVDTSPQENPLFGPIHSSCFASCVHCPKYANGWEFKIPKDWVFPLRPCDFGSKIAMCPAKTEQYLDHIFGSDYMVVKQNW